ncbi:pilus assembly protein TadG-related protein [Mesorhizobium sp. B4-1-1]|uniref:TadE/TadG family type IV pilus assembly protein n=1 Tax=Mesorhizobium sp. B4-1-1 TaxID=2589890 RepID=UPI0015E30799|nr:pilus assembly protein TadG-related protein [Mesorhizobium sp. B4-1-1]
MLRTIREFWNDQRGIAMILVAIMLPVLIGFALLAVDMSRATGLHSDLQKGVDALALAGAAELDGRADSITRANNAINNLIANRTLFSTAGSHQIARADVTVTYLTGIPTSDSTALGANGVDANSINWASTDPTAVSLVVVTLNAAGAGNFETFFPVSMSSRSTMDIRPQAVAGFKQSICETVPLFMCNPFETTTPGTSKTIQQAFASGDTYGREFRVLKAGNNPGPGNFGLLDNNLTSLRDAIAMGTAGTCYSRDALTTKTGVTLGQVNTGLNTRFAIYSNSLNKQDKNFAYRPSVNVRKGQKSNACNKYSPVTDGSALPLPDGARYGVDAPGMSDKITAQSFWSAYWLANHKSAYSAPVPAKTNPTGNTGAPASRYDVYRYEIDHGLVADQSQNPTKEVGTPQCYKGTQAPTDSPDRRLLNMAIIDCIANTDKINGHSQIRPDGYASVFVNTPIAKQDNTKDDEDSSAGEKPISLEIVDVDGAFANNTLVDKAFRNEAQLYR